MFSPREKGQGLLEYVLVLILVAVVVLAIISLLGPDIVEWVNWLLEQLGFS